ncbi:MAG TPA: 50S ribosomal protein L30 [Anaerolineales bacterium]|nr:50S ribosomal protein L30 [Anaerolineales bacterium]
MANESTAKILRTPSVLRITLIRSPLGFTARHRATVRALGLKRMHQTVELADTPTVRGMLYKVSRLVKVSSGHSVEEA